MNSTEIKITQSIIEQTDDYETAYSALIHWRWSQYERFRRSIVRSEFKESLITNTEEYSILVFIDLNRSPTLTEIANYLAMEKSTVSEFIKRCINRQLVLQVQCNEDRRKRFYTLTKIGKEVLTTSHNHMKIVNKRFVSSLKKDEKQVFLEILVKLNEGLT